MSAQLDPRGRKALLDATVAALDQLQVQNGIFIYEPTTLPLYLIDAKTLPQSGKIKERLVSYISEAPFYDFVRETLSRELSEKEEYSQDRSPVPIASFERYSDIAATSTRLVDAFESLPWAYEITLPLPDEIGQPMLETLGQRSFSDRIRLVALDDDFKQSHPLESGSKVRNGMLAGSLLGTLAIDGSPKWPSRHAALQISISGFVGHYGISEPIREALSLVDSFLGTCVALNLFKVARKYHPVAPRLGVYFHLHLNDSKVPVRRYDLDSSQSQTIAELQLASGVEQAEQSQRIGNFIYVAHRLTAIFSDPQKNRQLISASKWLLNSYGTSDSLLSFVQATIVLEILLGDGQSNDRIGLTELLRNRCAYLIAQNHTEREEIKKKFSEIYDIRSKIVHTGKSKLTTREHYLLSELRRLGHSVIGKEIELLLASK